jgi:hypothetical protein
MAAQDTVETGSEGQDEVQTGDVTDTTSTESSTQVIPLDEQVLQSDVTEPKSRQMRDVNGVDEEGNLRWFPREHVTGLRGESEKRRLQVRERDTQIATLQKTIDDRNAADEELRLTQLSEQEKFQELANEWQNKFEGLQAENAQQQIEILRIRVAGEVGLPSELADRLVGETEELIRQDAERLAELVIKEVDTPESRTRTTQVVPGGGPPVRDDEARRREYFGKTTVSSVFDVNSDSVRHSGT